MSLGLRDRADRGDRSGHCGEPDHRARTRQANRPQRSAASGAGGDDERFAAVLEGDRQGGLLTAREDVDLAKRIERGSFEARQKMVEANARLVVSIANGR
jgi:DNA-directed RNA polymerase sigma subunit (sigma70/sigma32)